MPLTKKRWFHVMVAIFMFLSIVYLLYINQFLLTPLVVLIQTVFFPLVISGVLFYLCRPLVYWLEKQKVPNWIAILIAYLGIALFIYFVVKLVGPVISEQFQRFMDNLPFMISAVTDTINYLQENQNAIPDSIKETIANYSKDLENTIKNNLGDITSGVIGIFGLIGGVVNTILYLVLVPFILFYMLKDRNKFAPSVSRLFPTSKRENVLDILKEMDKTVAAYIQGQVTVAFILGILLYIGYLIIGLNYSLVLAMFGMFTNVIPFFGPFLAVIPALLVALFQDPILALYVAIIMLIAQQIEGNVISPNIMGKTLKIHPLTIIILVLTAGNLIGILGVIFIIPTYAVMKVIVIHIVKLFPFKNGEY